VSTAIRCALSRGLGFVTVPPTIGYYVHHHGAGHVARFSGISDAWPSAIELVALSQIALDGGVVLPSDVVGAGSDPTAGGALHWAPVGDPQLARRAALMVDWCADTEPLGVVVDVSCEAALLFRLAGTPTVVVRQHGDRTDAAHTAAFRSARRLLAPFPECLEAPDTSDWIVAKTDYCGFIAPTVRSESDDAPGVVGDPDVSEDDIVVLCGAGGGRLGAEQLETLAHIASPHRVVVIGEHRDDLRSSNIVVTGWVDDVRSWLRNSPLVVASAGNNAVADAASAGSALVVVAHDRPFAEQRHHAGSLYRAGVAAVATGTETEEGWRHLLGQARECRTQLAALGTPGGAQRAVEAICRAFDIGPTGQCPTERRLTGGTAA
jgi:hypothetical protein